MKILWITNIVFPEASKFLALPEQVFGGWLYSMADQLSSQKSIDLAIATNYTGKSFKSAEINGKKYYFLPKANNIKYQPRTEKYWEKICNNFNPDIIDIHGTEYPRALACMNACPTRTYLVTLQGIIGKCAGYHFADISKLNIIKHITIRDILRRDTLFHSKIKRTRNGEYEKVYLRNTKYVSGRTSWDYAHVKALNINAKYFFCNETLRSSFYKAKKWDCKTKIPFTLFLSQSQEPIKGLHMLLKAINLIKRDYPNIMIRVAGQDIIKVETIRDRLSLTGYGSYIKTLINKFQLSQNIQFLGLLNEEQMIKEYKKAHIFVCPSSIENSPNSLGEAQLIGTPIIASYVGGIPDMVKDGVTGLLYRFEEVEMLAENIRKIFNNDSLAIRLSENGIKAAEERHNNESNLNNLIDIYKTIIS